VCSWLCLFRSLLMVEETRSTGRGTAIRSTECALHSPERCPPILELHGPNVLTELARFALLPGQGVNARNYGNEDDERDKAIFYGKGVRSISKYSLEGVHLDLSCATCVFRRRADYCG
jgi:hypothetical protein